MKVRSAGHGWFFVSSKTGEDVSVLHELFKDGGVKMTEEQNKPWFIRWKERPAHKRGGGKYLWVEKTESFATGDELDEFADKLLKNDSLSVSILSVGAPKDEV